MANLLGVFLKEIRDEKQFLQKDIAECLHIDTPMYSKIERGERRLKKEQITILSNFLKIKKDELQTVWLADKVSRLLENENLALNAVELVKKNITESKNANKKI
jgi:transcriptional regulator with XRE-family HTH domain